MGVDMTAFAEVRADSGVWKAARLDKLGRPAVEYGVRNTALFAILAGIGNEAERFGNEFNSVAAFRGRPHDLSSAVANEIGGSDVEGTAVSWLSAGELDGFDWRGRTIRRVAAVDSQFAGLFEPEPNGFPYDRWPAGQRIGYSPWGDESRTNDSYRFNRRGRNRVTWIETYSESAGPEFMNGCLPRLMTYGSPENVRLIMAFNW